ncbi:MAG: glutamate--tRNA ligase [Deinococcales bacterium]
MTVATRIAPSPTGDPHVGTAYIGLFNYAFAKSREGRFVFRLEDTDRQRYEAGAEARILEMFQWLAIVPDEGPDLGGNAGPYRQSERLQLYGEHVARLLAEESAYRAFETPEQLDAMRTEQKRLGKPLGYDGRGRSVSRDEQERRAAAGEAHVVRLVTPDDGETAFQDVLRGEVSIANAEIRDPVLLKSDGYPTYHLANVVDDHLMGITHVIRAEEWVTSTPIHVLLYRAFGWEPPAFIHMPLLRNPDKSKVSKRKLDTSVESSRSQGILPEALLNFLATMGWSMPDGREFFSLDDMVRNFDITRVSLGGPVFDLKKLRYFNARYLRDVLTLEEVARRVAPLLEERGLSWSDHDYLLDVVDVLRPRSETLVDLADGAGYFFTEDVRYDASARKQLAAGQKYLEDLERELSILEFFDFDGVDELLHDYVQAQSVGMGKVMQPLRAALTGTTSAPGVTDLVTILGKRRVLRRIGQALSAINQGLLDDNPQRPDEEGGDGRVQARGAGKGTQKRPEQAAPKGEGKAGGASQKRDRAG